MIDSNINLSSTFLTSTSFLPPSQIPMIEIPFGSLESQGGIQNGAFIALYTRELQPYKQYEPAQGTEFEFKKYASVLMLFRWDQMFGFPGGNVETGETLILAAIRELKEETGVDVKEHLLEEICSHLFKKSNGQYFVANLFAMHVSPKVLLNAQKQVLDALHAQSEILGSALVRFETPKPGRGIEITLSNRLAPSVMEELDLMMERLSLMPSEHLNNLRESRGFVKPALIQL
jgi:8-oxo-dGTP pyrophosphatase MutT (NUDIX family)